MNDRLKQILNEPRMGSNSNIFSNENNLNGLLDFVNFYNLQDKEIIEIGCYLGVSTELFAMFSKKVTSIDLWGSDLSYNGGECPQSYWPIIENKARTRLQPYKNTTLVKSSSTEYSKNVNDNSIDLIYIDGNHSYESVTGDITVWYNKIKKGGIISGHDYNQIEVKNAVDDFINKHSLKKFKVFGDTSWSVSKIKKFEQILIDNKIEKKCGHVYDEFLNFFNINDNINILEIHSNSFYNSYKEYFENSIIYSDMTNDTIKFDIISYDVTNSLSNTLNFISKSLNILNEKGVLIMEIKCDLNEIIKEIQTFLNLNSYEIYSYDDFEKMVIIQKNI